MIALELFSGIGGMHFALKETGIDYKVACALDINTTANTVYRHNFPNTRLMENNVQCLTPDLITNMNVNLITMSPPCQPFTRTGLQKDDKDNRTSALQHIINLLPNLPTIQYLILENVVGFETSNTRNQLLTVLQESGFRYQEFILSPCQPVTEILYNFPETNSLLNLMNKYPEGYTITEILDEDHDNQLLLPDKTLQKYGKILDIVTRESNRSCCFTKGYSHYVEGTGSVFCPGSLEEINQVYMKISGLDKNDVEYLNSLRCLKLRYFSPSEVAKLMAFPCDFSFPDNLTNKQKYRLLGNSLNVHVVAVLIKLLVL